MDNFLWQPSEQKIKESTLLDFTKYVNFKPGSNFKKLWEWSVSNPEIFWSNFWDYSKIIGDKEKKLLKKIKFLIKLNFFLIQK